MSSNINVSEDELATSPTRQLSLFPFDQWGAEHAVAMLEHPYPGIARAMIGLLVLGDAQQPTDGMFRCVAIADDGIFAAAIWVSSAQIRTPTDLWSTVASHLALARERPIAIPNPIWKPTSDDCFKVWSDPLFWIPMSRQGDPVHQSVKALSKLMTRQALGSQSLLSRSDMTRIESQALGVVREQIASGVRYLFSAFLPGLTEALTTRPRLSISMAQQLMALAAQHSPSAITYAMQALRTESFGLIHLITSGQPEREAREVREAIFSGSSLPDALMDFGVAKAVHRKTLRKPVHSHEPELKWSDIPIAGNNWLTAMRLTKLLPLPSKANWAEFSRLVEQILALSIQRTETAENLLKWCVQVDYVDSSDRLTRLLTMAQAYRTSTKGWTGTDVSYDDSIDLALELDNAELRRSMFAADLRGPFDESNFYLLALGAAYISRSPLLQIMQPIFDSHPGIPAVFQAPEHLTVIPLNQMALAMSHGVECENCIHEADAVVRYVAEGTALYGVSSDTGVVGTIALRCDGTETYQMVQVQEVSGANNMDAGFDLCHLAQSLADACNTPLELERWIAHERECSRWRDLAMRAV